MCGYMLGSIPNVVQYVYYVYQSFPTLDTRICGSDASHFMNFLPHASILARLNRRWHLFFLQADHITAFFLSPVGAPNQEILEVG